MKGLGEKCYKEVTKTLMFKWKQFHFDFLWNFPFLVTVSSLWTSVRLPLQVCGLSHSRRLERGFIWLDFFVWLVGFGLLGFFCWWVFLFGWFLVFWVFCCFLLFSFVSWIAESLDPCYSIGLSYHVLDPHPWIWNAICIPHTTWWFLVWKSKEAQWKPVSSVPLIPIDIACTLF